MRAIKGLGDQRVVWLQDPDDPAVSVFVAANPGLALQWICREASKKAVMAYVRQSRKREREAGSHSEPEEDMPTSDTPCAPSKRAKHTVTTTSNSRRANAKTEQDIKAFYRSIWHNSQEAEHDVRREDAFTRARASWLAFAGKQPEAQTAGTASVSEAIRRATAVGNAEAMRDLQLLLRHWRARHAAEPSSSQAPASSLSQMQQPTTETMIALRDGSASLRARYHYLRVESAEQLGAGLGISRRYHAARLREAYNALVAREVQPERVPPISKKNKGEVQANLYRTVRPRGRAQRGDRDYETFLRTLKHGKRWLCLEASFGCGIFALLPKSRVPNTYVERTLTDELLQLWIRTLHHCSPVVVRMAKEITSLIALFADDRPPPPYRTYLEHVQDDLVETDGPTEEMAQLLERVGEHARILEITTDDDNDDNDDDDDNNNEKEESTLPDYRSVDRQLDGGSEWDCTPGPSLTPVDQEVEEEDGEGGESNATLSEYDDDTLSDGVLVEAAS